METYNQMIELQQSPKFRNLFVT